MKKVVLNPAWDKAKYATVFIMPDGSQRELDPHDMLMMKTSGRFNDGEKPGTYVEVPAFIEVDEP